MIEDYSQGSRAKTKTKRKLRDFNLPFIVIHDGLRRVLVKANKNLSVDYALWTDTLEIPFQQDTIVLQVKVKF